MRNSVRKTLPLAIAFLLVLSGAAFAGDNAGVVLSLDTAAELAGVAGGATVEVTLSAAGLVNAKQFDIIVEVSPADAFDLTATTFAHNAAQFTISPGVEFPAAGQVKSGAASFGAAVNGDALMGTFNLKTADSFTTATEATIKVIRYSVGPSSTVRDVFDEAALGLSITVNPPAPPVPNAKGTWTIKISKAAAEALLNDPAKKAKLETDLKATLAKLLNISADRILITGLSAGSLIVDYEIIADPDPAAPTGEALVASLDQLIADDPAAVVAALEADTELAAVGEPTLTAGSATDFSRDYSAVGDGSSADGSAGEVTMSVNFTDETGEVAAGQAVSWAITNNGSETVYVLGEGEVAGGGSLTVAVATGATGSSAISLDAEGGKLAGTTSIAVVASVTAANSEGVDKNLSVTFAATWDVPVAAELASFAGAVTPDDGVLLQWSVASQSNNLGWEVYRSTDDVAFEKVGDLVVGDGTSDEFKSYSFTDGELPAADVLYYYLKQVDLDGTSARSSVIEVVLSATAVSQQALPTASALQQNYPNPFNPETTISFDLSAESVVKLTVYSMTGQVVRTLVDGKALSAGQYKSVWDGRDENGAKVGSGVYFYQLNAGDFTAKKKMTLLQ
jgi:hypothetical protein